jgi:hypothetical protein
MVNEARNAPNLETQEPVKVVGSVSVVVMSRPKLDMFSEAKQTPSAWSKPMRLQDYGFCKEKP